jgi:hypothetical protein
MKIDVHSHHIDAQKDQIFGGNAQRLFAQRLTM